MYCTFCSTVVLVTFSQQSYWLQLLDSKIKGQTDHAAAELGAALFPRRLWFGHACHMPA